MSHPRREARERALELLYESEAKSVHPADVIGGLPVPPLDYATTVAEGVGDHVELLDHLLGARARGWTVPRMAAVDRALLRLATFELAFEPEVPTGAIVDEAVELARAFSTDSSPGFVNGLLAAVAKDVRGDGRWSGASRPRVLVLDCDGVVRHYDHTATAEAEAAMGLPAGAVAEVALESERLRRAMTGELQPGDWADEIGRVVAEHHGVDAGTVSRLWEEAAWEIDPDVVSLVRSARARGVPTACFSNATSRLEDDLARAGVDDAFDVIVNSSRIGHVKPDAAAYAAACEAVAAPPAEVLFVDDRVANVVGALEHGIHGVRYRGVHRLRAVLERVGML